MQQSRAAADQTKLNGILLELRILTQRCLTEEDNNNANGACDDGAGDDGAGAIVEAKNNNGDGSGSRVQEEVDALLENLLVARRELMGHQLDDATKGDDDAASDDDEKTDDVDYAKLIQQTKAGKEDNGDETTSSDDESSADGASASNKKNGNDNKLLAEQVQNEYASLQSHWKSILNKHHSNLALHSGMSVNSSKFQSRAVDVSFWEQVKGGVEDERFKQRSASSANNNKTENGSDVGDDGREQLQFDDSKLYHQMLKDFISSSQTSLGKTNKKGMMIDPAQEAATRLKRAMRKKSGGAGGDVDLTSLLTSSANSDNGIAPSFSERAAVKKKKAASTVDRRASKGRKIRYTVNLKLVNFTFPVARPEQRIGENIWFKSLFGGVGNV